MEKRGLQGVAALVGTRLGVGSFVSWTLLLARINLLPPPLTPPPALTDTAAPSSPVATTLPSKRKGGLEVALPVLVPTVANAVRMRPPLITLRPPPPRPAPSPMRFPRATRRQRRDRGGGGEAEEGEAAEN